MPVFEKQDSARVVRGRWVLEATQNSRDLRRVLCSVAESCPTLSDPMDCRPPGSSVHGDSPGFS